MNVIEEIAAERRRQMEVEGWTPEHDDKYDHGEMAAAATCYAYTGARCGRSIFSSVWPWSWDWYKPTTTRRNLIKAAALLLAEIERLDRIPLTALGEPKEE